MYNRKMGSLLIGLAVWLGLSRIYVGHHYPSDVLGGVFFGLISATIVIKVASGLFIIKQKTVWEERADTH